MLEYVYTGRRVLASFRTVLDEDAIDADSVILLCAYGRDDIIVVVHKPRVYDYSLVRLAV